MKTLEELSFKITYSGPTPNPAWGKHWIHASKFDTNGKMIGAVYGYGEDVETAIEDAVTQLKRPK